MARLLNTKLSDVNSIRNRTGIHWGIEYELEGRINPNMDRGSVWELKTDGSLRSGIEIVSRNPMPDKPKELDKAFDVLKRGVFDQSNIRNSCRCSTHVHMNVLDLTIPQIVSLITLYMAYEKYITQAIGEDRDGNLFCMPLQKMPDVLNSLYESLQAPQPHSNVLPLRINSEYRYASLNLASLYRFGTVELRSMAGIDEDPAEVKRALDILRDLRHACVRFDDPAQIMMQLSAMGPEEFARSQVFPNSYSILFPEADDPGPDPVEVFSGVRLVQPLVFETDWEREVEETRGVRPRGEEPFREFNIEDDEDDERL